ncbi:MAG: 2Fe-2S iron-sulfur cluster-binding protein [Alphaproteobacteria bacterium]
MMLNVTDREGRAHALEAIDGWRVMEIIRDYGMTDKSLAIKAECGGSAACGTCHVYVDPEWLTKLMPPNEEEEARLADSAFGVEDNSRLSCQILMSDKLDGLAVTIAPGTEP